MKQLIRFSRNGKFPQISNVISELFQQENSLYFLLLGQSSQWNKEIERRLEAEIPSELKKYKYILHPIRLSILKFLYTNLRASSIEIKEIFNLTWSDYSKSITALQTKGYINLTEEFDDFGLKRQYVYLEEKGKKDFEKLTILLKKFVESVSDFLPQDNDDFLYPSNLD